MTPEISDKDRELLNFIRARADELAALVQEAGRQGFTINYQINGAIGACDRFDVFKMVPVDMRSGAN
jgi:hypothetical protein